MVFSIVTFLCQWKSSYVCCVYYLKKKKKSYSFVPNCRGSNWNFSTFSTPISPNIDNDPLSKAKKLQLLSPIALYYDSPFFVDFSWSTHPSWLLHSLQLGTKEWVVDDIFNNRKIRNIQTILIINASKQKNLWKFWEKNLKFSTKIVEKCFIFLLILVPNPKISQRDHLLWYFSTHTVVLKWFLRSYFVVPMTHTHSFHHL